MNLECKRWEIRMDLKMGSAVAHQAIKWKKDQDKIHSTPRISK